jgi:acetoin utilization deacetylase AcuC-like enzyme
MRTLAVMTLATLIESSWPLSETCEWADLVGAKLTEHFPQERARLDRHCTLPMVQARDYAFLCLLEQELPRAVLTAALEQVAADMPLLVAALEAELAPPAADAVIQGEALPAPLSGQVNLYAPSACSDYPGYGEIALWTEHALAGAQTRRHESHLASDGELSRAHDPRYIDELFAFARAGGGMLGPETTVRLDTETACRAGAGALLAAARARAPLALCLARPGSHHASRARGGGTCLVNNLAVAAYDAIAHGYGRVAIVDLDAHHGNGTEEIFQAEPRVLTVSVHQAPPFYPGTGDASLAGRGVGDSSNLNLTVEPHGSWKNAALHAIAQVAATAPELVLVEFSTDAHWDDRASDLTASDEDFAAVGGALADLGCPLVCELGSSLSERAWIGGLRGFVRGFALRQG